MVNIMKTAIWGTLAGAAAGLGAAIQPAQPGLFSINRHARQIQSNDSVGLRQEQGPARAGVRKTPSPILHPKRVGARSPSETLMKAVRERYGSAGERVVSRLLEGIKREAAKHHPAPLLQLEPRNNILSLAGAKIDDAVMLRIVSDVAAIGEAWRPEWISGDADSRGIRLRAVDTPARRGIETGFEAWSQQWSVSPKPAKAPDPQVVAPEARPETPKLEILDRLSTSETDVCPTGPAVISLAGPGGAAYGPGDIQAMRSSIQACLKGARLFNVGDGASPASLDDVRLACREMARQGQPITLVVSAHGDNISGGLALRLGEDWVPSEFLFQLLREELGPTYSITVFLQSCHSGSAVNDASGLLPKGGRLIALTRGADTLSGSAMDNLWRRLGSRPSTNLDGDALLFTYLNAPSLDRSSPVIMESGHVAIDLGQILNQRIGKPFAPDERERIIRSLENYSDNSSLERRMQLISDAKHDQSIFAVDYAACMAIAYAAECAGQRRHQEPQYVR